MGKTVVALGDASLTTADLSLLVPPSWMNDQLISFWFEHLRIHILQNDSRAALLLPNVAYFVALTDGTLNYKKHPVQKVFLFLSLLFVLTRRVQTNILILLSLFFASMR